MRGNTCPSTTNIREKPLLLNAHFQNTSNFFLSQVIFLHVLERRWWGDDVEVTGPVLSYSCKEISAPQLLGADCSLRMWQYLTPFIFSFGLGYNSETEKKKNLIQSVTNLNWTPNTTEHFASDCQCLKNMVITLHVDTKLMKETISYS